MNSQNSTKYVLLVGDGMADYPIQELGGKTPLEVAQTPNMDKIAACRIGCVKTIPDGKEPGSDVANLSLLGYDPDLYHTGRAPFEAASMGVNLNPDDVAFRMNLVTLDWKSDNEILMKSHSSGDISTGEARQIVETLEQKFIVPGVKIFSGIAYRHLIVWDRGPENAETIPPHDVLDQNMASYLNQSGGNPIPGLIRSSWELLKEHPANIERKKKGLYEANSIWLWGQGKAPKFVLFENKYGLKGGVISAVDLLRGIGIYAGFTPIYVKGATGYLNTNYKGKAKAALEGLKDLDFIFLHVEAPDEAGHNGDFQEKIQAIENFDRKVVGVILEGLKGFKDYKVMVVSDHFTPVVKRTHTSEPAPFAFASKAELASSPGGSGFTEKNAQKSGDIFWNGHDLMPTFLGQFS